ncbi:MAG: hypothetical protein P8099_16485 [Gemmatimonadota bacterium]|jgi:hypothetical protein
MTNDRPRRLPRPLMHSALRWLLVSLIAAGCDWGVGPDDVVLSEPFDYQQDATGRTRFRVVGINGDITITGVAQGDTLRATGFRRVRNCSRSQAEQWMAQLQVQVSATADEIVVQTVQPLDTNPCTLEVEYEVTVPARLAARAVNVNGNVTATDMGDGASVTNVNGNVTLAGIAGSTRVRLTNGNIAADVEIAGAEAIDLLTVNGNVALAIPTTTSAMLLATVINGTISIANLVLMNQVSTGTTLTGTLGTGEGDIALRTTNGNIAVAGT